MNEEKNTTNTSENNGVDVTEQAGANTAESSTKRNERIRAIQAQVADAIKDVGPVIEKFTNLLVSKKHNERADLLVKAFGEHKKLKGDVDKIRPTDSYSLEGKKVPGTTFTKEQNDARNKALEAFNKLEKAFEKALNGDFNELENMLK